MARKLRYRTYIIKLWLATMVCAPLVFVLFALIIDARLLSYDDSPLELGLHIFVAISFVLPTFLFFVVLSLLLPFISRRPQKLKRAAILTTGLGFIAAFFFVYDPGYYSSVQLYWGLMMVLLYAGSLVFFGLRFKI
ncbi:MAG TPA: hypothetical protein VGO58_11905 [Chitinophagaceae bacterium]|nr:hypothetical protein [Chitinophagaceae bacterium]